MDKYAFNADLRRLRRKQRRARLISLLGGKCQNCGTKKDLQFDHIDKKTKNFDISNAIDTKEEALIAETKKCQLLCKKCHLQKTKDSWDWHLPESQHGTLHHYRNKRCRCDECKKAVHDYYIKTKKLKSLANVLYSFARKSH